MSKYIDSALVIIMALSAFFYIFHTVLKKEIGSQKSSVPICPLSGKVISGNKMRIDISRFRGEKPISFVVAHSAVTELAKESGLMLLKNDALSSYGVFPIIMAEIEVGEEERNFLQLICERLRVSNRPGTVSAVYRIQCGLEKKSA